MTKLIQLIKEHFLKKDFFKFLVIGVINTLGGTVYAAGFSLVLQENLAFNLGYITALVIAYFLNTFFVFREKPDRAKFVKFLLSYVPNYSIQNAVVFVFYNWAGLNYYLVLAIAAAVGLPVTFLLLKLFAFRKNKKGSESDNGT